MDDAPDSTFRAFLARRAAATAAFFAGDPAPWLAMASHTDDVTMFGGFGGYEQGWEAVAERYRWAAATNAEGSVGVELIACHVSGDLACTVAIERGMVRAAGTTAPAPKELRITELFRRVGDDWQLVHRHADPLVAVRHAGT